MNQTVITDIAITTNSPFYHLSGVLCDTLQNQRNHNISRELPVCTLSDLACARPYTEMHPSVEIIPFVC